MVGHSPVESHPSFAVTSHKVGKLGSSFRDVDASCNVIGATGETLSYSDWNMIRTQINDQRCTLG